MERTSIKYFVNNSLGLDRNISSVGFEEIPPNTSYPTYNHSAGYYKGDKTKCDKLSYSA